MLGRGEERWKKMERRRESVAHSLTNTGAWMVDNGRASRMLSSGRCAGV